MKAIVEKLEDVPEAIRSEYEQRDGKYVLKLDDAEDAYAAGLKRNNAEIIKENKKLKEQMRTFDGIDDPEKARELIKQAENAAAEAARVKGDWEAREKQIIEKHQGEITKRDTAIQSRDATIARLLIDTEAINAIKNLQAFPAAEEAMLPHIRGLCRVIADEKAGYRAEVLDRPGGTTRVADGNGAPMTIAQLIGELAEKEPWNHLFPAKEAAGSGAPPARTSGGNGHGPKPRDKMTTSEKVAFIEKHGHEAFVNLPTS